MTWRCTGKSVQTRMPWPIFIASRTAALDGREWRTSASVGQALLGERSANSPQEVQPSPTIVDDAQRYGERISAGQTLFSGTDRR